MTLKSHEHIELMAMFERIFTGRMDREDKAFWAKGRIYQNGQTNELFLAFRHGVAYGQAIGREAA
jgi:uncharacterized membrane protein